MIDLQFLSNFVLVIICFVMASVFLVFSKHQKEHLFNYRVSLQVLSLAYLCLALLNSFLIFSGFDGSFFQCLDIFNTLICSLQTMLFAITLISLYNHSYVTRRVVFFHFLPILIFFGLYLVSYFVFGDVFIRDVTQLVVNLSNPTVVIRLFVYAFCVAQLVYYFILFFKHERVYKSNLENYFSDLSKVRLLWVRYAFFFSLFIGVLALIFQFNPNKNSDLAFTFLLICFYFLFAIKYISYGSVFNLVEPSQEVENQPLASVEINSFVGSGYVWTDYKQLIIDRKDYLREGITLEEMAQCLRIGRTSLSNYINNEENMNFNSWINSLRIEEAKLLFLKNPEYTIIKVANLTGYTEQSNFTRHFKSYVGTTPSLWRKNLELSE